MGIPARLRPLGERLLDSCLGLTLLTFGVTALNGRVELDVLSARLRVSGVERPFFLLLALLALEMLFGARTGESAPAKLTDVALAAWTPRVLALLALFVAAAPLFAGAADPARERSVRALGYATLALVLCAG